MLTANRAVMDKLAKYLIKEETITGKEFMKIYRKEKGIHEPKEDKEDKASKAPAEAPAPAPAAVPEAPAAPANAEDKPAEQAAPAESEESTDIPLDNETTQQ